MLKDNENGTFSIVRPKGYGESQDERRYRWLRNEFAHGRETYLAEGMPSEESLDKYIDEQLKKAQGK